MIKSTFEEKEQKRLVKKFHVLLGRYGIDSEMKQELLCQYGVTSSVYLNCGQLVELCGAIERANNPEALEADKWRKRLMGAVGGWLRKTGQIGDGAKIKGIACRASGRRSFNEIPMDQLRNLYYAFLKKQKDVEMTEQVASEELLRLTMMN